MKIELLQPEPNLEFGDGGLFHDIRFGIGHYGVYDYNKNDSLRELKIGIVGTEETINALADWLELCRSEIAAKPSNQPNLFPPFPGFAPNHSFCSRLTWDTNSTRAIIFPKYSKPATKEDFNKVVKEVIALYLEEINYILEKSDVRVVICAPSIDQLRLTTYLGKDANEDNENEEKTEDADGKKKKEPLYDFHDALKAELLSLRVPIQLVLPATYDDTKLTPQKEFINRDQQDEATRAWNLHTALYYKSRGVPWRMIRLATDLETCFLGISFFKTLDGGKLYASSAQVFNERGEGVVVKGGVAIKDKDDRQVHLDEDGAFNLITSALGAYHDEHFHYPARVVVHKTSPFSEMEIKGCIEAFKQKGIEKVDLAYITPSRTRLFRPTNYPPLRGTLWHLEDHKGNLYTKGSVPFYETYPGKYPPQTLFIDSSTAQRSLKTLAEECMALTKMNWNSTRFDQKLPITLQASREVGHILKYLPGAETVKIPQTYRFYM